VSPAFSIGKSRHLHPVHILFRVGGELLVGSAHYILGPFGSDSDLRRHGEKLASRGAKNAKKRAAVAVARKLAVLLHSLWVSAELYEPLRNAQRFGGQAA
jgi:hypothetical protein